MYTQAPQKKPPRIITNMTMWQSKVWETHTDSIYNIATVDADPPRIAPWREAIALFRKRPRYDVVHTMGGRESLLYGLLCLMLCTPAKQIMTEVFIDIPRHTNPLWRLKKMLYRCVIQRSLGVMTNSRAETDTMAKRFHLAKKKFHFVPLHTTIRQPTRAETEKGFILSAGRTLRDYPTLLKAARDIPYSITIVCGAEDLHGENVPTHITVHKEVTREFYLDQLERCSLVLLPLEKTERSTGQVVMLEAMALGNRSLQRGRRGPWITYTTAKAAY